MKSTLITGFTLLLFGITGFSPFICAAIAAEASLTIPPDHYAFHSLQSTVGKMPGDVTNIIKDSRGYIWLGTVNGLFRYDGNTVESYGDDQKNKARLSNRFIYDLAEDSSGNLWVATRNGLNKLSLRTHSITHYFNDPQTLPPERNNGTVSDNRVPTLLLDHKRLLVGTATGLYALDLNSEAVSLVLEGYHIRSIYKDKTGALWIGTAENGLLKYNERSKSVKQFSFSADKESGSNVIRKIVFLENHLWLGTENGLIQFDLQAQTVKKSLLKNVRIMDIAIESKRFFWVASLDRGILRYHLDQNTLKEFEAYPDDAKSLKNAHAYSLFIDEFQSSLWIGGQSGTSFIELSRPVYLIRHQLPGKAVWSINVDRNKDLLIGTTGFSIYNTEDSIYRHYDVEGDVFDIAGTDSKIWLSGNHGLFELDKINHTLTNRTAEIELLADKSRKLVLDVAIKDQYQLLIASYYGLILWDQRTQLKTNYTVSDSPNPADLSNFILNIYNHNATWLAGGYLGLYIIDFNQKKLKRYLQDKEITALDKVGVNTIASDSDDYIWAGTMDGLFKLKDRKIVAQYNKTDGLPDVAIHNIVIDKDRLWLSTNHGMAAFEIGEGKFEKVHLNNDSFDLNFNSCKSLQPNNGYLYFCSTEGAFYFKPGSFYESVAPPKALITGLRLFNRPQQPGTEWLPQAIEFTDQLILDYQQNIFSFEFSSMNFSQSKHLYAYQMVGITKEDEWIITDSTNRLATFTAQNPGTYMFRVKSGWDKSTWSDDITQLKVIILPPWWRTNIAYICYIVILLLCIVWVVRVRTNLLHKQAIILKQEVDERTEEIQGLLKKKNELFANVSHELRTPLTLILGPANRVLHNTQESETKNELRLIKRSGQRLQALVEQLLLFSKLSHFESLQAKPCSVKNAIQVICASMRSLMDENQLILNVGAIPDVWVKLIPEDALQTTLVNLLSNAAKYTPAEGKIDLSASLTNEGRIKLIVADTGLGIPEDWREKVFERFSRMPEHAKSDIAGTGLGLPMVKDLLEMNGGHIHVSNAKGGGAVFTVVLPIYQATAEEREHAQVMEIASLEPIQTIPSESPSGTWQEPEGDTEKPTLLVIDDTTDMRSYLASEFIQEFNVLLAEDGKSGLQLIRRHGPDLIVCDVMMPGMDGFEVLKHLRADINISHTPLILLTAKEGKENRIKGYEERADDYIVKPFEMDELKVRVKNILDLRKLWQEQAQSALVSTVDDQHALIQNYAETEKRFLEKFKAILDENFQDPGLDVEAICNQMHLSQSSLNRKIKALLGTSPYQYLRIYRLQKAAQILKSGYQGSLSQLAEAMGFSTQQHFARSFKDNFGVAPKDYKG